MTFGTVDIIRLQIGDTDAAAPKLSDAEIQQCIDAWPDNTDLAAANAAEAIAATFADRFDFQTDRQVFNRSAQYEHYVALAGILRSRGGALESS
jgi:hypothetical protein